MPHRYAPPPFGAFDPALHLGDVEVGGLTFQVRVVGRVVEVPADVLLVWAQLHAADAERLGAYGAAELGRRRVRAFMRAGGIASAALYRHLPVIEQEVDGRPRFVQPLFGLN